MADAGKQKSGRVRFCTGDMYAALAKTHNTPQEDLGIGHLANFLVMVVGYVAYELGPNNQHAKSVGSEFVTVLVLVCVFDLCGL